jgi:DNA-binding NarL/FixJ family response regulator
VGSDVNAELTPRELQVARLLAQGLRDWQIARELHRSVRTVEAHIRNAYRKTGTGSRARLALWAREHDSRIANPEEAATAARERN